MHVVGCLWCAGLLYVVVFVRWFVGCCLTFVVGWFDGCCLVFVA